MPPSCPPPLARQPTRSPSQLAASRLLLAVWCSPSSFLLPFFSSLSQVGQGFQLQMGPRVAKRFKRASTRVQPGSRWLPKVAKTHVWSPKSQIICQSKRVNITIKISVKTSAETSPKITPKHAPIMRQKLRQNCAKISAKKYLL